MSLYVNSAYYYGTGIPTFVPSLSDVQKVSTGSNLSTTFKLALQFDSDYNVQIAFTNEYGKVGVWKDAEYTTTESVTYSSVTSDWGVWYYEMQQDDLSLVSRVNASKVNYQVRVRLEDTDYVGALTTTETFDAVGYESAISTEIIAEYGTGTSGQWVLVTDSNVETRSFESNGSTWSDLGYEKSIYPFITLSSGDPELTALPVINANESSVTNSQAIIFSAWLTSLSADVAQLQTDIDLKMDIADYDTEGTATDSVKYARNLGTNGGGSISYATQLASNALTDQDVTSGSNPTFGDVAVDNLDAVSDVMSPQFTLYNVAGNAVGTYDGQDVIWTYGNKSVEMAKNLFIRVKATVAISNGDVVQYAGSIGASGKIEGKPAVPSEINVAPYLLLGVATEDISVGQEGEVNFYGRVNNVNTLAYNVGDILYYDSASADGVNDGGFTTTQPIAPNVQCKIAIVTIDSATVGQLAIRPDFGQFVADLHDVYANGGYSDGDILRYNMANSRFELYNIDDALSTIDNLGDVNAPSPNVGEFLGYNGVEWVPSDVNTTGAGKSITFYVEDVLSGVSTYETLSPTPLGLTEEDDSATVSSGLGEVLLGAYATEELGRTKVEAGNWFFETFARVSSVSGTSTIKIYVYKRTSGGTETELFNVTTETIDSTTNMLYSILSTQAEFTLTATDRLVVKYYGITTSVASLTMTLVHSGTEYASHIDTPLQTLHNDLAGLQGGSSNERYHLTQTELTDLQNIQGSTGGAYVDYSSGVTINDELDSKVDLVLYNDSSYVVLLSGGASGTEYLFVDKAGTKRKMTLDEVATYANTATGAFVPSGQYQSDGLGAFRSATVEVAQGVLNTGSQVYVDIRTVAQNVIYYVQMPTISSTNDLELSVDNQTTYYDVLFEEQNVQGADVSGKLIKVTFDGTQFNSMEAPSLVKNVAYTGADGQHTIGANGIGHAITKKANTAPTDIRGRTIEQLVSNPDFSDGTSLLATDWSTVGNPVTTLSNGEQTVESTDGVGNDRVEQNISVTIGQDYYYSFEAKLVSGSAGLYTIYFGATLGTNYATGAINQSTYTRYSGILTASQDTGTPIQFGVSGGIGKIAVRNAQVIQLPSDITTVAQAEAMLDGTILSQGIHSVGDSRVYAVADYPQEIQDYIEADGTVAGDTIQGVYSLTRGKNQLSWENVLANNSQISLVEYGGEQCLSWVGGALAGDIRILQGQFIPNTRYTISVKGASTSASTLRVVYTDGSNDNIIANSTTLTTYTLTTDSGKTIDYIRGVFGSSETSYWQINAFQIELGTVATTYEPYEYSVQHTDGVLYGIGGVYDDENTQRFDRDYNDVVQSATGWSVTNDWTNVIGFSITLPSLPTKLQSSFNVVPNSELKIGDTTFNTVSGDIYIDITEDSEQTYVSNTIQGRIFVKILKSKLGGITSADFEAYLQANDVEFIYELDTYLPRTIDNANLIPINGTHIVSPYSTWHSYGGGLVPQFDMESAYSLAGQLAINVDTDIAQGKVLTNHESRLNQAENEIDTLQTDVGDASTLDTTSKEVVGAINEVHGEVDDHLADTTDAHDASAISYVNTTSGLTATELQSAIDEVEGRLDTAESNATSAKTKTDFITVSQNVNLDTMESDIATNNAKITYPSTDSTKVGYLSVTSAINLDKVAEWTTLYSGTLNIPNTAPGSSNLTLSSADTGFDMLAFVFYYNESAVEGTHVHWARPASIPSGQALFYADWYWTATSQHKVRVARNTATGYELYDASTITYTFGSPANIVEATTLNIDLIAVYGINF